jgi:hypothetical protein
MTRRTFSFDGLRIAVDSPDVSHLVWLEEFLSPQMDVVTGEPHHEILFSPDRERYDATVAVGAGGGTTDVFALDSGRRLPLWKSGPGRRIVFDEPFRVFYILARDSSRIEILARNDHPRGRTALMRVIRELAMGHAQSSGGLVLHASAFSVEDRGFVLAGPRKSGKTTLLIHALRSGRASYLANDRVLVNPDPSDACAPPRLRGLPTIIVIRETTADIFPDLKRRLATSGYSFRLHKGELPAPSDDAVMPWKNGNYALTPAQFLDILGTRPAAVRPVGAVLFPKVTPEPGGIELRRIDPETASAEIRASLLGTGAWRKEGDFLARSPLSPAAGSKAAHGAAAAAERLTARVPCFECRVGIDAYADASAENFLGRLPV